MSSCNLEQLQDIAQKIRIDIIESLYLAGSGHPGGSLSIVEMLTVLYFDHMKIDPCRPSLEDRDRLVLSKGHAAPAVYATLSRRGYFNNDELKTLRKLGSRLQGHPDKNKLPGIDMSTGSLGQGVSAACGMALFAKRKHKAFRVYAILGDGELQEGQVWEALMSASHNKLDNLTILIDNNNLQIDGRLHEVMSVGPLKDKFEAFGMSVHMVDGHKMDELKSALEFSSHIKDKPSVIICATTKGKGVSFMENQAGWHGAPICQEQCEVASAEIMKGMVNGNE